ncbi:MAG: sigma-70 family RNA polymerase sigma factor [Planctomycetota bacterium]
MSNQRTDQTTDAFLVMQCQLGDQEAWRDLVQRWNPRLVGFFGHMVSDSDKVDDLLQGTWLRIVRTITRLDDAGRFTPWAYRIARNTLTDQFRKQYRSPPVVSNETQIEPSAADFTLEQWIDSQEIATAMTTLHSEERLAITLHYFEHLTVAEVAEVCRSPVGTIKSRLQRARKQLQHQLHKEQ